MKKFVLIILAIAGFLILVNIGPVWLQRLIGFSGQSDNLYYPQWINNEEYCYLRVKSFFDYGLGFSAVSPDFFNPLKFFRGPNATFYVYRANINEPGKDRLLKRITMKVDFQIPPEYQKIPERDAFIFRRLDSGELSLIIRGHLKYIAYSMNTSGTILKKQVVGYSNFLGSDSISDISPDGKKILLGAHIKDMASGRKVSILDWKNKWFGPVHWISKDKLIDYNFIDIKEKKITPHDPTKVKYEIYLIDENKKNSELVCTKDFLEYTKHDKRYRELPSYLDAALFSEQNLLFLSKIGIFKKKDEKWEEIKDLKDMEFNFYYPDWSFDGKRIVGISDGKLKIIEVKDLLKN